MPKFVVYDERVYVVEAEDEDAAFDRFTSMTQDEADKCEVDGGHIDVEAFITVH